MKFTIAQLETFLAILDAGTFQAAGERLHVTQPTISQRIKELESALGVPVFVRRGPKVILTPEGNALVGYARRLMATAGELAGQFQGRNPLKGILRLGVPTTFAMDCMADFLLLLEDRFPALKASVWVSNSANMAQMLDQGELDIAILVEPISQSGVHQQQRLGSDTLVWIAGSRRELPAKLRPADIADLHILVSPPPSRLLSTVTGWFDAGDAAPTRVSMTNNIPVTLQLVESGLVVAPLPLGAVRAAIAEGRVKVLDVHPPLPAHRIALCWRADGTTPGITMAVEMMKELVFSRRLFQ